MGQSEMIANAFGEQYLYAVNRDMFEQESARIRIEREFGDVLGQDDSLVVFIGSDSGNIIRYLAGRELSQGARYIFIEPDELFSGIQASLEPTLLSERVMLVTPSQFMECAQSAGITNYLYIDAVHLRRSLSAEYGFVPQYRSSYWDIDSQIQDLRWNTITSLGQDAFIQRQLQNCADNACPLSAIKGCLEGKTVVVLGGGPSLDEHLEWIQAHRHQLVLFAVSRISSRLLQVGLEPDFVFSVDPQDISYEVSKEMLHYGPGVVFVNQYHVAPRLLSQWPHRTFFMGSLLPWTSELNPEVVFAGAGPTVTNSAIAAAAWLGSKRIFLSGVDLCFTPEGYTHAKGSKERAAGPKTDLSQLTVKTNAGSMASTTSDYASAAGNISLQATVLAQQGVVITNLAAGATRMEAVEYRAIEDVVLAPDPGGVELPVSCPASSSHRLARLRQELEAKLDELGTIQSLLKQASELHARMYEDGLINRQLKRELERLDGRLDEYPELMKLVKMLSIHGLLRMAHVFRDIDELQLEEVRKRLEIYYSALLEGAKQLHDHLQGGLESICIRAQEHEILTPEQADALVSEWVRRGEPGRIYCVERQQSLTRGADVAERAYREEMQRDQLSLLARQNKIRNLQALPGRVQQLKDMGDIEGLEQLYSTLLPDSEASAYIPLIAATICEMQRRPEQALQALLPVMEQPESPVLEQALALMVGLCTELGYHQAVLDAMAGLASLNAQYLGLYAEALAANGQVGDAIEHLTAYMHYFPGDIQAIETLRSWYAELANVEGVALMESLLRELKG